MLLEERPMRQIVPNFLVTAELIILFARMTTLHLAIHSIPGHLKTLFPTQRLQTLAKTTTLLERRRWYHTRVKKENHLAWETRRELLSSLLLTERNLKVRLAADKQCLIFFWKKMFSLWSTPLWRRLVLITPEWARPRPRQFSERQWRESTAWWRMTRLPLSLRATGSASSCSTDRLSCRSMVNLIRSPAQFIKEPNSKLQCFSQLRTNFTTTSLVKTSPCLSSWQSSIKMETRRSR